MTKYQLQPHERQTYLRYASLALPRHTSYPIAPVWCTSYQAKNLQDDLHRSASEHRPLSLYVHVPYCRQLCYYCACNKEIIPDAKRSADDPSQSFLEGIAKEIEYFARTLPDGELSQIHLGGGSPTFLHSEQLAELYSAIQNRFTIDKNAEIAIEVDPRITSLEQLQTLRSLGFNRISLGVQDFDPQVQKAVNRIQSYDQVAQLLQWCRELGFDSINFDLIYGLPYQTLDSMGRTLDQVLALAPDRVAFYRLAVIPEIFRWQNTFSRLDLSAGELSLDLNLLAIEKFQQAGYLFIGLDHFAKPDEALSKARDDQSLHRTFQGMTTGKALDVLGLGPSGITQLADAFAQNWKESGNWKQAIAENFATERGMHLSEDDRIRRELMQQLYGHGQVTFSHFQEAFRINFTDYFAKEMQRMKDLIEDGLLEVSSDRIRLSEPLGRLLVRVVAAVFDNYLPANAYREGLPEQQSSKVG